METVPIQNTMQDLQWPLDFKIYLYPEEAQFKAATMVRVTQGL